MQQAKDKRLALEFQDTYKARLEALNMAYSEARKTYPKHLPYPHVCSIFSIPRIRSIVCDTPKTTTVTACDFDITSSNLADVISEATDAMHRVMLASVISGLTGKVFDPDTVMLLATTVFRDVNKKSSMRVRDFCFPPEIITSPGPVFYRRRGHLGRREIFNTITQEVLRGLSWDHDNPPVFDREAHNVLCTILNLCGYDPSTTLYAQLEDEPPVVECIECSKSGQGRMLMTWSWAPFHIRQQHSEGDFIPSLNFIHVVDQEATNARIAFKQSVINVLLSHPRYNVPMICVHCDASVDNMPEMQSHLQSMHDIPSIRPQDIQYTFFDGAHHNMKEQYMQEYWLKPPGTPLFLRLDGHEQNELDQTICQYLHPTDLLSLGRVSRSFHNLVKSDEFRSTWLQARAQLIIPGIPECPEDMNQPAYFDMFFGSLCHVSYTKITFDGDIGIPKHIAELLPSFNARNMNPPDPRLNFYWGRTPPFYSNMHLESWKQEYSALNAPGEKADWEAKKLSEQQTISEHANRCQGWLILHRRALEDQHSQTVQRRSERATRIVELLEELGWKDELDKMSAHPHFRCLLPQYHPDIHAVISRKNVTNEVARSERVEATAQPLDAFGKKRQAVEAAATSGKRLTQYVSNAPTLQ
ncbi:hypothetical protein CVT24_004469 [Panaeolus cyanescens]|uniref:F-box domain-containing protein n=1 Tax=Panaeolus cyanescens TaxID=181874 RepID=A0A409VC72_9AGAR|nr:hypothetical protein CVT24_004469 [Panaeolus cyanescens]